MRSIISIIISRRPRGLEGLKMAKDLTIWIEVRKRFRLTDAQIQMARELGLNPHKFGSLANTRQEPWKVQLPEFIENIYFKRFRKTRPDSVQSIEAIIKDKAWKKAEKRAARHERKINNPQLTL